MVNVTIRNIVQSFWALFADSRQFTVRRHSQLLITVPRRFEAAIDLDDSSGGF